MNNKNNANKRKLNEDVEKFAEECISFDLNEFDSNFPCLHNGVTYFYINNGQQKLAEIAKKYATKEILPKQMSDFVLETALQIKGNFKSKEEAFKDLDDNIKSSVQMNKVLLPVSGILLKRCFKIGVFTLYSKKAFTKTIKFANEKSKNIFNKNFAYVETVAVGEIECNIQSAKAIARKQLIFELSRFKAFIPLFSRSLKHWIFPLITDYPLSDCSFVFNKVGWTSDLSIVSNLRPLELDEKVGSNITIRAFLNNKIHFNQIVSGKSDLWTCVHVAFEWLGKQYDEENDENKLMYSIFSLECLLNSNTENFSSITAAVSEKCAYLLGTSKDEKKKIFHDAKELYSIRSALVHSSNKSKIDEDMVKLAYEIAMSVLLKVVNLILKNNFNSIKDLDEYILALKFK